MPVVSSPPQPPTTTQNRRNRTHRYCQCTDCLEHPDCEQGQRRGRLIPIAEANEHMKHQRRENIALTRHSQLHGQPSVALPLPAKFSRASTTHPDRPNTPSSPPHDHADPQSDAQAKELLRLRTQLKDPVEVIGDRIPYFSNPPSTRHYVATSTLTDAEAVALCELDPSVPSNSVIIGYQQVLARTKQHASRDIKAKSSLIRKEATSTVKLAARYEEHLREILLQEWRLQRSALKQKGYYDTCEFLAHRTCCPTLTKRIARSFKGDRNNLPAVILGYYLVVSTIHFLSNISMDVCSFLLGCFRVLLQCQAASSTSPLADLLPKAIRTDMRTVTDIMDIRPISQRYAVCPKCRFLFRLGEGAPELPETCSNSILGEQCGAQLVKPQYRDKPDGKSVPISQFHYQPLADHIARMYSRPELEPHLHRDPTQHRAESDMWDIWDSPCFADLKGPDGQPFLSQPSTAGEQEGRLVFIMNMDGFNPGGNKEAGKKVTVGAIYMMCANLPPSLRYKMENVYLAGIIPGPNAPSDHEINYFLEPLISELLNLWKDGIFLSRTTMCRRGHRVRCAVGPLVCDLPAARQMSGFAHYRSKHFCSECTQTIADINNLDRTSWTRRSGRAHRAAARSWKNARTQEERERIMGLHGVRWSELLRLPYWDPTKFTVIDPMHAFYLRLFQHHCRSVWGMDINFEDGDGITFDVRSNAPTEQEMKHANHLLRHGTLEALSKLRVEILRQLNRETSTLPFRRRKSTLVEQLKQYVIDFVFLVLGHC